MALIKQNKLGAFFESGEPVPGLVLIYGEPYLTKQAFKALSSFLLGSDKNAFAIETFEAGSISMGEIMAQAATFSFLVSKKIVTVKNMPLFQAGQGKSDVRYTASDIERLSDFIEKGLPKNHFLVLITPGADKRKKIYKTIDSKGLIIDCAVAAGVRKADQDEQRTVLQAMAGRILSGSEKTMDSAAFQALVELTGFNLDLFAQNLEKLIVYSGKNPRISAKDVKTIIVRDKKDPVFNLTNAILDKDVRQSLFYLNSLFDEGLHILQILKALENQIRKLVMVNCFTHTSSAPLKRLNFNQFKQTILPGIVAHDQQTKAVIEHADTLFSTPDAKKKNTWPADLLLAPNPKNAYPVFLLCQKSENFSREELVDAICFLSDLDFRLKSSSFDARTQIERFIITLCSKGGFVYAPENKNRRHHF